MKRAKPRITWHVAGVWRTGKGFSTDRSTYRQGLDDFAFYRDDSNGVVKALALVRETSVTITKRKALKRWRAPSSQEPS